MITITPLFSGSRGNSTLIRTEKQTILLDCGYGFRALSMKLKSLSVDPRETCVVITHEHSDHISALKNWTKYYHTDVYAPQNTSMILANRCFCDAREVCGEFDVQDVHVDVYQCSHDATNCYGYRFTYKNERVASVTDTGFATPELSAFLSPCKSIILESNHDVDMLWHGEYSYFLKQRIASDFGHLSNDQATEVLAQLIGTKVRNVILGHLSQQNNTARVAYDTAQKMYSQKGVKVGLDVCLYVADQDENGVTV